MKTRLNKYTLSLGLLALLASATAFAQMPPPGAPPGKHRGDVPSAVALATIPGLSATQQTQLRHILIEQRKAMDSARQQWRKDFEALRLKQRNERDRIEDQTTQRLRKALGDSGYKAYAEWRMKHGGRHHRGMFGPKHPRGPGAAGAPGRGPMPPPDRGD